MRLATQPLILTTFIVGLVILVVGGVVYGRICERVMKPTDAETPATALRDDIDFVPMAKWRNSLIELLNIAGTGPILGPIQGILFGPIAFITIPIGCIFAGAFHDYMVGMISIRNKGGQTPDLIRLFLGPKIYYVYAVFVCLLLLLVGVVFVYTPGDIFILQILHQESTLANPVLWIVYGVIFGYYVVAALFPIDKIIGRVYPIFGAILLAGHILCCLAFLGSTALAALTVVCLGVGYPIATIGPSVWAGDMSSPDQYPKVVRRLQVIYAGGALLFASVPGILADRFGGTYIPAYILFSVFLALALLFIWLAYRENGKRTDHNWKELI